MPWVGCETRAGYYQEGESGAMPSTIEILGIGKKNRLQPEGMDKYIRMLRPFSSVQLTYLKPPSQTGEVQAIREREADLYRARMPRNCIRIALSEEGERFSSPEFARWIDTAMNRNSSLVFLIGGAYGLSSSLKRECDLVLSLSPMTFPHGLCVHLLVEQLYRTYTILKGHPYHKE